MPVLLPGAHPTGTIAATGNTVYDTGTWYRLVPVVRRRYIHAAAVRVLTAVLDTVLESGGFHDLGYAGMPWGAWRYARCPFTYCALDLKAPNELF